MKRSKKNQPSSLTNRRGLMLAFYIAAFVGLIYILVYYAYIVPMQRSLE